MKTITATYGTEKTTLFANVKPEDVKKLLNQCADHLGKQGYWVHPTPNGHVATKPGCDTVYTEAN